MSTQQEGIKFYIPKDEADEFRRVCKEEDRTMTAVLRRMIRERVAAAKTAAT